MPSSRTVLVTGATDGLGRALAARLAEDDVRLVLHGRDAERVAAVADELRARGAHVETVIADFAELRQVRRMADELRERLDRIDVLVNNAGVGSGLPASRGRQTSRDGHELRLAVNHLAGFALTSCVLPLLHAATASSSAADARTARVVFVASRTQEPIDWDDVMLERDYSGRRAYAQSKLAQITIAFELAERLAPYAITVTSLHPASFMPTKIVLEQHGHSIDTLEEGVEAVRRLALSPELEGVTGRYFWQREEATPHESALDPVVRRRLWDLTVALTGERAVLDPGAGS